MVLITKPSITLLWTVEYLQRSWLVRAIIPWMPPSRRVPCSRASLSWGACLRSTGPYRPSALPWPSGPETRGRCLPPRPSQKPEWSPDKASSVCDSGFQSLAFKQTNNTPYDIVINLYEGNMICKHVCMPKCHFHYFPAGFYYKYLISIILHHCVLKKL